MTEPANPNHSSTKPTLPHEIADLVKAGKIAQAILDLRAIRRDQSLSQVMATVEAWRTRACGENRTMSNPNPTARCPTCRHFDAAKCSGFGYCWMFDRLVAIRDTCDLWEKKDNACSAIDRPRGTTA